MVKKERITISRLRQLLDYNPATGILTWKPRISPRGWNAKYAGKAAGRDRHTGMVLQVDRIIYPAHHIIWALETGAWPKLTIDHKNRNWRDNRIENLREATPAQQCHNRGRTTSVPKGVRRSRSRFIAVLGSFETADEAHAAWLLAAKTVYGEFFTLS